MGQVNFDARGECEDLNSGNSSLALTRSLWVSATAAKCSPGSQSLSQAQGIGHSSSRTNRNNSKDVYPWYAFKIIASLPQCSYMA